MQPYSRIPDPIMSRIIPDRRLIPMAVVLTLALLFTGQTANSAPEIRVVSVRGLQIDGVTTIRVDGTDLLPNPQLALSVPIAKQVVKPGATAARVDFEVTLGADIEPGIYNLWLASDAGVSLPEVVALDRLPQLPFAAEVESLPVALHGTVGGSARLRSSFAAKAAEEIIIEVEAQRLGGKLRPVLHVFDAANKQLAWTLPSRTLRGDARLRFTAPTDGTYTVELHDLQYAAPAPNFFRLKIGSWEYADRVFPPAIQRGSQADFKLISNDAAETTVAFDSATAAASEFAAVPWKDSARAVGLRPSVLVSQLPELVENTEEELQKLLAIPSAVSGRLFQPRDEDKYQLDVETGAKLRFEVFADRIGSPIDVILELQNDKGGRLAVNDDANGSSDSRLDYTVPADVTNVIVAVKDVNGRGGPGCIYRVTVKSLADSAGNPDFRLRLEQQRQTVAAGNWIVVKVMADRDGYDGPIELKFDSLPDGVQVRDAKIAAGTGATLLTLHGPETQLAHTLTQLRGIAQIDGQRVERIASVDKHVLAKLQPWLRGEIGVAVSSPSTSGFKIDWGEIGTDTKLILGGKLDLPVSTVRPVGFDGPVRLVLETSQTPVMANTNIDTNRTLRSETNQPIEIVVDANAQKAWDAQLAADKVVVDAEKNQTTIAENGRKAAAVPEPAVKAAADALKKAQDAAAAATVTAKAASDADAEAQKSLADATAQAAAAAKAVEDVDPADEAKLTEAKKVAADAAALVKTATDKKAATTKALATATTAAQQATVAVTTAEKTHTTAMATLKAAIDAAAKANADAEAKVKDAVAKQQAAAQAASTAAAAAKNDGTFSIFVPAELGEADYQVTLRAELLSRDKRTVLDRGYTALQRFSTLIPVVVSFTGSDKLTAEIDPKAGVRITINGEVERLAGMEQDVTVSLVGLPPGVAVPTTVVKPDQSEFNLEIVFPAAFKPAELESVRVFATGKMRANAPIVVRSKEIPLFISLLAKPEPPPAEPKKEP